MRRVVLFYLVLTLFFSGSVAADGAIWDGLALLIGSAIGFAGGSGARGSLYRGQKTSGILLGGLLLLVGAALPFYAGAIVRLLGPAGSGDNWVFLGFVIGFFAARPEDAGVFPSIYATQNEDALMAIGPIAAAVVAERLTAEEAEKRIKDSAQFAPKAPGLWHSMSANEREELGLNFMKLAANPEFVARFERHLEPLERLDPELWEQSLAKARVELGYMNKREDT